MHAPAGGGGEHTGHRLAGPAQLRAQAGVALADRVLAQAAPPATLPAMIPVTALTGALLALALFASAAEPPPPPSPSKGEADKPPRPEWRGGFGGFGRPPRHDGFDKLPEAERRKVREALDRVWNRPEVIAARDEAMRANDAMRRVIREALQKTDPEAAAILARLEPREGFDPSKLPPLPPPEASEFPEAVVARMASELQAFSRPERREETRQMHERVMAQPALREAYEHLKTREGEARIEALHALRKAYREAIGAEFQAARERRAAAEGSKPTPP